MSWGSLRVSANRRPGTSEIFPGRKEPISSRLINYENRKWETRFRVWKNDSDTEVTDDCVPTWSEMMRLNESDTDSDIPYLIGPPEIQKILDIQAAGLEETIEEGNPICARSDLETSS